MPNNSTRPLKRKQAFNLPPLSFFHFVFRICECTEAEAEIILQLKNELREKELKLTDIRLEALSSAHHLDQIREAMNRMQVSLAERLTGAGRTKAASLSASRNQAGLSRGTRWDRWEQFSGDLRGIEK